MEKVVFKCYRTHTHGKNKGKVNFDSIVHITLMRDPTQGETVGSTLKRCKALFTDPAMHVTIQSAKETDEERAKRYAQQGLELVSDNTDKVEAGDETMIQPITMHKRDDVHVQAA